MPSPRKRPRSAPLVAALLVGLCGLGILLRFGPAVLLARAAGAPAASPASVWEALEGVRDPELGAGLVELGLVRSVQVKGEEVDIELLLTSPACPYSELIAAEVRRTLSAIGGVRSVRVRLDRRTAWSPEMASPALRRRLAEFLGAGRP